MKKDMSLEGLRWSCDSGSALYDTPPNGRSRTGWGGKWLKYKKLSECSVPFDTSLTLHFLRAHYTSKIFSE